ncbi:MAG: HAD family phosphatase [Deltaproteobacteria bacterium]|nr:HAD family phosphatase [Deltaproteobacteria bacterium]
MFRAILFDFDGVLADTEPLHFGAYHEVLGEEKIDLTKEEYTSDFLGLDDRGCFRAVCQKKGKALSAEKMKDLIRRKNRIILDKIESASLLLPHVREFLREIKGRYYLAIVSGALRSEILSVLAKEKIEPFFKIIITADDVKKGKPDPEGFLTALRVLNRDHGPESDLLLPEECLVVEDSPWGLEAAKKAGMKSAAVTNSYPKGSLKGADWVIESLKELQGIVGKSS